MDNIGENAMKDVVNNVAKIMMSLDVLNALPKEEKDRLNSLANSVVGLRDTNKFNISVNVDREDVKRLRRDLASAISAEKFAEGFMVAFKLLSLVGAI